MVVVEVWWRCSGGGMVVVVVWWWCGGVECIEGLHFSPLSRLLSKDPLVSKGFKAPIPQTSHPASCTTHAIRLTYLYHHDKNSLNLNVPT